LIIRPDLCLNCNSCDIARICPEDAIDRLYIGPEDDFKGIYELEYGQNDMNEYGA
jgi:electron transport complex protein RnfB